MDTSITYYEKLSDIVHPKGTCIPNLSARLVKRNGNLCLYERSDFVWEVFFVQVSPAQEIYGKPYPAREIYPNNEDFGVNAWCYSDMRNAERKYQRLIEWGEAG